MRILSVDLASKHPRDLGIAVLEHECRIHAGLVPWEELHIEIPYIPSSLAEALAHLAERVSCNWIALDGPAGWKSPQNGLQHSRVCDRRLNAPAKVGLPDEVKPRSYAAFVRFSIDVFDALAKLGFARFRGEATSPTERAAVEILPMTCWRRLGLPRLPGKAKCRDGVAPWAAAISRWVDLPSAPRHDELQAVIGGIAPLWLAAGESEKVDIEGSEPFMLDDLSREGFIVAPRHVGSVDRPGSANELASRT